MTAITRIIASRRRRDTAAAAVAAAGLSALFVVNAVP
jgi:H+/Cl- antiporter ClcA